VRRKNTWRVRSRSELHERVSTRNENENPEEGRLIGLSTGGKVA